MVRAGSGNTLAARRKRTRQLTKAFRLRQGRRRGGQEEVTGEMTTKRHEETQKGRQTPGLSFLCLFVPFCGQSSLVGPLLANPDRSVSCLSCTIRRRRDMADAADELKQL